MVTKIEELLKLPAIQTAIREHDQATNAVELASRANVLAEIEKIETELSWARRELHTAKDALDTARLECLAGADKVEKLDANIGELHRKLTRAEQSLINDHGERAVIDAENRLTAIVRNFEWCLADVEPKKTTRIPMPDGRHFKTVPNEFFIKVSQAFELNLQLARNSLGDVRQLRYSKKPPAVIAAEAAAAMAPWPVEDEQAAEKAA